jgi:O6-methylguanine-DNA--protein-cysteine methyltransferase
MARKYTRKKLTKAAKLNNYFMQHPTATAREAADAVRTSYNTAWKVKKRTSDPFETSARTFKRVVDDTGATKIELSHPPTKKLRATVEELKAQRAALQALTAVSDGSTASYYELPQGAKELQDLISYKDMNAQIGEIFRATYRYGQSSHSDKLRDAKKIRFYIDAEIKRLGG